MCAVTASADVKAAASERLTEHFACTVTMSSASTSGELRADLTMTFAPASSEAGTWTGSFTLSNRAGTWTGSGTGAAVRVPEATRVPGIYGEVVYWGSGAYTGLFYRQLLSGAGAPTVLSGWISGPLVIDPPMRLIGLGSP